MTLPLSRSVEVARAMAPTPLAAPVPTPGSGVDPSSATAFRRALLADLRAVGATVDDLPLGPSEAFRLGLRHRLVAEAREQAERMSEPALPGQRVCTAPPEPASATPQPPSGAPRPCRNRPRLGP